MLAFYVLLTALIVSSAALLHEWGHVRSARRNKMHVTGFAIGFGAPLHSWTTKRGLAVTLKMFPIGGSTAIAGTSAADHSPIPEGLHSFISSPPGHRWRVCVSGSALNLLVAWVAFCSLSWTYVEDGQVRNIWAVPLAGVLAVGLFIALILGSAFAPRGGEGLNSILAMPTALEEGVGSAATSHGGIAFYLVAIVGIVNLIAALGNLLPLHPLDGFRALIATVDAARLRTRKDAYRPLTEEQVRVPAIVSGLLFAGLVAYVFIRDILAYLLS